MSPVSYVSAIRNVSVSHRNSLHGSCVAFNALLNVKNLMSFKIHTAGHILYGCSIDDNDGINNIVD